MRHGFALTAATIALLTAATASAVTITNHDQTSVRLMVCDEKCGPSHGDDWGSAFDFWLQPGEARSFDCTGTCFVGIYYDDHSPTLGDMAVADDDEMFEGNEAGYIRRGIATHKPN
ncbi:MAG: hypothetical protein KBA31_06055 [Alphaproteobacteria bacterium]|nr:hypothetical protein [Alphaproteobacteria bacterium]